MKRILSFLLTFTFLCVVNAQENNFWSAVNAITVNKNLFADRYKPQAYKLFKLDEASFKTALTKAPSQKNVSLDNSPFILSIPNADGQIEKYKVVLAPVMDSVLAEKYPSIKTYAGRGINDPSSTIYLDFSLSGLHVMILSSSRETIYIDPVDRDKNFYVVFSRREIEKKTDFKCSTPNEISERPIELPDLSKMELKNADDGKLRTYRLALACSGEYAQFFLDGTETSDAQRKTKVLSVLVTLLTRVNGIFERDFSVHMNLISNNDALIYLDPSTDPWTTEFNTSTQQTIDAVITSTNYDIGHLVHKASTPAQNNGNAGYIGSVCQNSKKGSAFSAFVNPTGDPFNMEYVCHEMGHQFGANHTFTFRDESETASKLEPGAGTTIMGYGGIYGLNPNVIVQSPRDDYFHARSIEEVTDYVKSTAGGSCAVVTQTGNSTPTADAGVNYTIPKSTPFTLTGIGADADASDVPSYTWEQMNPGTSATTIPNASATSGPAFRSARSSDPKRNFPALASVIDGTNGNKWEVLPSVQRTLNFRFTVRDNHPAGGSNKSDDMNLTISNSAGPFKITSANSAETWTGGSCQLIKWDVANSDKPPVSCVNVKILFSTDGGQTFPTVLIESTPNDGKESITVPSVSSTTCRIKIEALVNIFFDINDANITVSGASNTQISVSSTDVSSCSQSDGKATITVTGTDAGHDYEYAVDGIYQSSNQFNNLTAGDHVATARYKDTKCEFSKDFNINGKGSLSISISGSGTTEFCNTSSPPSVTLIATATGGSGNYNYTWPGGSITLKASGKQTVTVTDNVTGCKRSLSGEVVFVPIFCSRDPNDIVGPVGYGNGKMVSKFEQMPYMIHFENDPDFATAPAQIVKISHPLDSNLNILSFRLGDFGFGGFTFSVPPNRTYYTTRLDLKDTLGVVVDVTAGIDITKKEAFWIFESKDPATGLPPANATLGFLPVNDSTTHRGEGFVNYTIKPANYTQTGDTVLAAASIIFDINAPLATPTIFNTIDAEYPVSIVSNLPASSDTNTFRIKWTGQDEVKGSGVRLYDLYVSENGGVFKEYQTGITDTFTTFIGKYGFTYDFYTRATDNTGNKEAIKTTGEQRVIVRSNLLKPNVGADTTLRKCPGDAVNLNVYNLTGLYAAWNTPTDSAQVAPGVFTLIVNNPGGLKDTAFVTVIDYPKPNLGSDTTVGYCAGSFANIRNVYNTTGYASVIWSTPNTDSVGTGTYTLMVSNATGCRDTAMITVFASPIPNLGRDTAITKFSSEKINITRLYDTTGLTVQWNTTTPSVADTGTYQVIVANSTGCKDTAVVTIKNYPREFLESIVSGDWSDKNTWQASTDSVSWTASVAIPTAYTTGTIIHNTHTVNVTRSVTADHTIVDPGGVLSVAVGSTLNVLNNGLTLRSNADSSASIGISAGTITGNVTVERFIPARRAWRLITAPFSNTQTIREAWQEGLIFKTGYGTHITGGSAANGFDQSPSNSSSIKRYNQSNNTFDPLTSTVLPLTNQPGYMLFVRGDRTIDLALGTNAIPTNTILRATGALKMGTQPAVSVATSGFTLVSNPYASPVDFAKMAKSNVPNRFYVWDSKRATVGAYVLFDSADNYMPMNGEGSYTGANIVIQSGQAFFVQGNGNAAGALTITENSKSAIQRNVFRAGNGTDEKMQVNLRFYNADSTTTIADAAMTSYSNFYSPAVTAEDAGKLDNIDENIAIVRDDKKLMVERRPLIDDADTTSLKIYNMKQKTYQFETIPSNFSSPSLSAYLEDAYLNTTIPVSLSTPTMILFKITNDTASANPNRFRIVYKTSSALPVNFTSVKAYGKDAGIQVDWDVATEINIKHYEVEKSANGQQFTSMSTVAAKANNNTAVSYNWFDVSPFNGNNFYRIKAVENTGSLKYSEIVNVRIGNQKGRIVIYPNPAKERTVFVKLDNEPKGTYIIQLFNSLGQQVFQKTLEHSGGSATQTLRLNRMISKGAYQIHIKNGEIKVAQQVIFD